MQDASIVTLAIQFPGTEPAPKRRRFFERFWSVGEHQAGPAGPIAQLV